MEFSSNKSALANRKRFVLILKGLVAGCHSFCLFFRFCNIHTFNTFIQYIYPSPFAGASLHFLIACKLSGINLPVVPSRISNSGLPYSKSTRYQLSHAFLYISARYSHIISFAFYDFRTLKETFQCTFTFSIPFFFFLFAPLLPISITYSAYSFLTIYFANSCCSDSFFIFHSILYCSLVPFEFNIES